MVLRSSAYVVLWLSFSCKTFIVIYVLFGRVTLEFNVFNSQPSSDMRTVHMAL